MYHFPFTNTEIVCKYLYEHGLDLGRYLTGNQTPPGLSDEQMHDFRHDILTSFIEISPSVSENVLIPENADVIILRQARYLSTQEHVHEYIEFCYLMEGECKEFINGKEYNMKAGDLVILSPGTRHHDITNSDDALLFFIIVRKSTFQTAFLSLLSHSDVLSVLFSQMVLENRDNTFFWFHTGDDPSLKQIVSRMYQDSKKPSEITIRRTNICFELICLELLENHFSDVQSADPSEKNLSVAKLLDYFEKHVLDISPEETAAAFGYSRRHIERLIKANTGYTFNELATKTKLQHSLGLLQNPSLTVTSIALASGFEEESTFYRAFKKYMHMTPTEYRKSIHAGESYISAGD